MLIWNKNVFLLNFNIYEVIYVTFLIEVYKEHILTYVLYNEYLYINWNVF